MAYQFKCSDMGYNCPFAVQGESEEEVLKKAKEHGKAAHAMTDKELNDPELDKKLKGVIKKS